LADIPHQEIRSQIEFLTTEALIDGLNVGGMDHVTTNSLGWDCISVGAQAQFRRIPGIDQSE